MPPVRGKGVEGAVMKAIRALGLIAAASAGPAAAAQPAYVGRWSHVPAVEFKSTPDATLTAGGLEGNEISCRFTRVEGGNGRWRMRMSCHGEGDMPNAVDLAVKGNVLEMKYPGDAKADRLTRCP